MTGTKMLFQNSIRGTTELRGSSPLLDFEQSRRCLLRKDLSPEIYDRLIVQIFIFCWISSLLSLMHHQEPGPSEYDNWRAAALHTKLLHQRLYIIYAVTILNITFFYFFCLPAHPRSSNRDSAGPRYDRPL